jgi:hypothetical protein
VNIGLARSVRPGTLVVVRMLWPGASVELDGVVVRAEFRCEVGPLIHLVDFHDTNPLEVPREDVRLPCS